MKTREMSELRSRLAMGVFLVGSYLLTVAATLAAIGVVRFVITRLQ